MIQRYGEYFNYASPKWIIPIYIIVVSYSANSIQRIPLKHYNGLLQIFDLTIGRGNSRDLIPVKPRLFHVFHLFRSNYPYLLPVGSIGEKRQFLYYFQPFIRIFPRNIQPLPIFVTEKTQQKRLQQKIKWT